MKKLILLFLIFLIMQGCRYDESDSPVNTPVGEYVPPVVSTPSEGSVIYTGTEMKITWAGFKSKKIRLELWKKKQYNFRLIASEVSNSGSFSWTVPYDTPASVSYQVKLLNYDNQGDFVYSGFFSIKPL